MPDAQPQSPVVAGAKLRVDVAQTVVACMAATKFELGLARDHVKLVMGDQNISWGNLVKAGKRPDCAAAQVHEGLRLEQPQRPVPNRGARHQSLVVLVKGPGGFELQRQSVNKPEAGVVPGLFISRAGVAQAHHQADHGAIIR